VSNTYTLIKLDGTKIEVPFLMQNGQPYVSEHIAKHEVADRWTGEIEIFEPVIQCFEEARKLLGSPIGINSGFRSPEYQQHLKEIGYKTATNSPHCWGAALDLAIPRGTTYLALVSLFKQAARNLKLPKPRFGFKEYGYTFVHFDYVYLLFSPYTDKENPCPGPWRAGIEW
jgi:hypothetical protein